MVILPPFKIIKGLHWVLVCLRGDRGESDFAWMPAGRSPELQGRSPPRSKEAPRSEHLPVRDLESDPGNRSVKDLRASEGTRQIECWNEAVLSVRIMS